MLSSTSLFLWSTLLVGSWAAPAPNDDITEVSALAERTNLMKRLEPQYQNFDQNNDKDKLHLEFLHRAFTDSLELMSYAAKDDMGFKSSVYGEYFSQDDKDKVKQVFLNAWDNNDKEGAAVLNLIIVDNKDFDNGRCDRKANLLAYIRNEEIGGVPHARLHFCDRAFATKLIGEIKCEDLGDTVSQKMRTLGSIYFHEFTHFDEVGKKAVGQHIGDFAYGPAKSKALDKKQAVFNADSYTWFALENFWTIICGKDFSKTPTDQDAADATCGNDVCEID